jgi:hypothetical protein
MVGVSPLNSFGKNSGIPLTTGAGGWPPCGGERLFRLPPPPGGMIRRYGRRRRIGRCRDRVAFGKVGDFGRHATAPAVPLLARGWNPWQSTGVITLARIRSALFTTDPYEGFRAQDYPVDMQGWGSTHPFFRKVLQAVRPTLIIEVGTWKGGSAIHMGGITRDLGLDTEIVCVDTWLGSQEHFLDRDKGWHDSLRYVNGYPRLYYTFLANVVAAGLTGVITPLPLASDSAAVVLASLGVRAGVIYVDAAHEYASVLRDMQAFWPLLADDGIIMFDDYGYSDVTVCACEFAASVRRPLYATYGKALISKNNRIMELCLDRIE